MANPKQVIVIRRDLMQPVDDFVGKMIAQGSHASLGAFLNILNGGKSLKEYPPLIVDGKYHLGIDVEEGSTLDIWLRTIFTKICVYVDSEEELIKIYEKAKEMNLPASFIRDIGLTKFDGIITPTAVAIGPAERRKIDKVTRGLPVNFYDRNPSFSLKKSYIVALEIKGLEGNSEFTYGQLKVVLATSEDEAIAIYNDQMNCDFSCIKCLGIATSYTSFPVLNQK